MKNGTQLFPFFIFCLFDCFATVFTIKFSKNRVVSFDFASFWLEKKGDFSLFAFWGCCVFLFLFSPPPPNKQKKVRVFVLLPGTADNRAETDPDLCLGGRLATTVQLII